MRRAMFQMVAVLGGLVTVSQEASAQQLLMPRMGYPVMNSPNNNQALITSPVVSPYLNMTDLAQLGVANYQTLVQPFVQQRQIAIQQNSSIQQLQRQVRTESAQPKRGSGGGVRDTGHETRYFNYSHYFGSTRPY